MSATTFDLDDEPWDVFGLLTRLKHYRLTIVVSAVLVTALAAVLAFTSRPIYRADVMVVPNTQQRSGGALGGLADQVGSILPLSLNINRAGAAEPVALLRSRLLAEEFIRRNDLLPKLFPDRWDAAKKQWIIEDDAVPPTLRKGVSRFLDRVVNVDDESVVGLVKLSIEGRDRGVVADWANGLISLANELTRKRTIEDAKRRLDYLQAELQGTESLEVREAIYRVMEAEVKSKMLASVQRDSAFRVLDPAATPDASEFIKPRRPLLIGIGLWFGTCLGIFIAFVRIALAERRRKAALQALQPT